MDTDNFFQKEMAIVGVAASLNRENHNYSFLLTLRLLIKRKP